MKEMRYEMKRELKAILEYEKNIYMPWSKTKCLIEEFYGNERCLIYRYLRFLRKEEYYLGQQGLFSKIKRAISTRRKNRLGNRINIKIMPNMCGIGVNIHHKDIIINGHVGDDCIFHGNNCIGNNRMGGVLPRNYLVSVIM